MIVLKAVSKGCFFIDRTMIIIFRNQEHQLFILLCFNDGIKKKITVPLTFIFFLYNLKIND